MNVLVSKKSNSMLHATGNLTPYMFLVLNKQGWLRLLAEQPSQCFTCLHALCSVPAQASCAFRALSTDLTFIRTLQFTGVAPKSWYESKKEALKVIAAKAD